MITKLELTNFKNFKSATLQLGGLTLLVGTNASGKSNVRDAFRFLHGVSREYSLAEIIGEKYIEGGALQWRGIRGGTREVAFRGQRLFALVATLDGDTNYEIEVLVESGQPPRISKESLKSGSDYVFHTHGWDDPPEQEANPNFIFARFPRDRQNRAHGKRVRFLTSQPILTQLKENAEAKASLKKAAEKAIATLGSMRFLDLSPDAMRIPSIPGQTILGDRGENLSSVLQAIASDEKLKHAVSEWIRELRSCNKIT